MTVLSAKEFLLPAPSRTIKFEGEQFNAGVSFFWVDLDPGDGPDQHRHPYAEVFVPLSGSALFMSEEVRLECGEGELVVVPPMTAHGFKAVGQTPLRMMNIHASGRMITEWLDSQ